MADRNGYIGRAPSDSSVVVSRQIFSPTGVTTDFTFASGYTVGYLDLYLNGSRLIEGPDYAATDGATISLISPAQNGDVLEGVAYKAFTLADDRVGIQSSGVLLGQVETLNFIGTGNTFAVNGSTIDVSISDRVGIQSSGVLIGQAKTLNFIGTGNTFAVNGSTIDVSISGGGSGGSTGAGGTWGNYDGVTGVTTTKKVKIQNDLQVTGVSTFAAVNATTGSFSGNVSVGGTLTYEDVTNVDSVGLVTARTGVRVNAGGLVVTAGVSTFAADLSIADKIVHTGDTNTAIRFPAADVFSVETGGTERGRFESGVFLVGLQGENRNFGDEIAAFKGNRTGAGNPGTISLIKDGSNPTGDIGLIHFGASDDHDGYYASIRASSDGSTGGADLPGRLTFETTADGAASPTERLRIASAGQIGLGGANYGTSGQALISNGSGSAPTWQDVSAGITTEAATPNNTVATLNLTAAQDHKVTASGITTITVSGGTEADSHTVRIINSGITTVGFSTYFLFPSGSVPSLPTADGAISLISFTVNRVGAGGTQLLAGASLNFS